MDGQTMGAKKLTWSDAIEKVMLKNNCFATLKKLNEEVPKLYGDSAGKTPERTISERLQRDAKFKKIMPGLWALTAYSDKLPKHVNLDMEKSPAKKAEITHSLIQGYMIEIGNIEGFKTFSPDKNKPFLNGKLKDISKLENIPEFTYKSTCQRIRGIDVIWFNGRGYPENIIEVEHTTNCQRSLLKFVYLQDFKTKMTIVAPKEKELQYKKEISNPAFDAIREDVEFFNYDQITNRYSHSMDSKKYGF